MGTYSTTTMQTLLAQVDELRDMVLHADALGITVTSVTWSVKGFTAITDKTFPETQRTHLRLKDELAIAVELELP